MRACVRVRTRINEPTRARVLYWIWYLLRLARLLVHTHTHTHTHTQLYASCVVVSRVAAATAASRSSMVSHVRGPPKNGSQ